MVWHSIKWISRAQLSRLPGLSVWWAPSRTEAARRKALHNVNGNSVDDRWAALCNPNQMIWHSKLLKVFRNLSTSRSVNFIVGSSSRSISVKRHRAFTSDSASESLKILRKATKTFKANPTSIDVHSGANRHQEKDAKMNALIKIGV